MQREAFGGILLTAGALLLIALLLLSPGPRGFHDLAREVREEGPASPRDARIAVFGGTVHSYDNETNRTLLLVAHCNHALCGPGVWVEGDVRGELPPGPWLLVPVGGAPVGVEAVGAPDDPLRLPPSERIDEAFTATFSLRPVWPSIIARAVAYAALAVGASLALPRLRHGGALAAALAAGGGLAVGLAAGRADPLLYFLPGLLVGVTGIVALATLAAAWKRERPRALAASLSVVLFALGFLLMGFVAIRHFPPSGAGD